MSVIQNALLLAGAISSVPSTFNFTITVGANIVDPDGTLWWKRTGYNIYTGGGGVAFGSISPTPAMAGGFTLLQLINSIGSRTLNGGTMLFNGDMPTFVAVTVAGVRYLRSSFTRTYSNGQTSYKLNGTALFPSALDGTGNQVAIKFEL